MRALAIACLVASAQGHATMIQPLSRGVYREKFGPCGQTENGFYHRGCFEPFSAGGPGGFSPCGISQGEDFTKYPWETEKMDAGQLAQQTLHPGSSVTLKVLLNAHHLGHVVYGICPDHTLASADKYGDPDTLSRTTPVDPSDCADRTGVSKASCEGGTASRLDTYEPATKLMDCFLGKGEWANKDGAGLLERSEQHEHLDPGPIDQDHKDRWYLPPRHFTMSGDATEHSKWPINAAEEKYATHEMHFKVPQNLNCKDGKCLLHFFYFTANSCTGDGYNEYFSEPVTHKNEVMMMPRTACTGGQCPTGHVNERPLGGWSMGGTWWHPQMNNQPNSNPKGTCWSMSGGMIDDSPTNTWARMSPERFWNCANVYQGGGGGTDPCAGKVCTAVDECQESECSNGQCQVTMKAEGLSCAKTCNGECKAAQCSGGQCSCVNHADNSACMGGHCTNGECQQHNPNPAPTQEPTKATQPPQPSPTLPGQDCQATRSCTTDTCTKECGGGRHTETCTCTIDVQPAGNGKPCSQVCQAGTTMKDCNTEACPSPPGTCLGQPGGAGHECTPYPQTCTGVPGCCNPGLHCCGSQWWASCQASCGGTDSLASFAAGKEGGSSGGSSKLFALIAGIFGGSICGGFVVFAALRARGGGSAALREHPDI